MLYGIWTIAIGALIPTALALLIGKAWAGGGKVFPVLPGEKLVFFLTAWLFSSAVAVCTYILMQTIGLDEAVQNSVAGFLVPMIAGALFVKLRLA